MDAGIQLPWKVTTDGGIHPCNLDPGIPCRDDEDTVEKPAAIQAVKPAITTPSLAEGIVISMSKTSSSRGGCRKSISFVIPGMDAGIQLPWKATSDGGIHPCNLDPGIPCRDDDDTVEKPGAIQAVKPAITTPSLAEGVVISMSKTPSSRGGCRKSISFVIPGMDAGIQLPWKATSDGGIHPCNLDPGIPCRDDDDTVEKSAAIQAAKPAFTTPSAGGGDTWLWYSTLISKDNLLFRFSPNREKPHDRLYLLQDRRR